MTNPKHDFDHQFEEIKKEYLYGFSEQVESVETLLLGLMETSNQQENLREIFRVIHSLKGGASSFEMNELAAILHRFETFFSAKDGAVEDAFIDSCLSFIDLLKSCVEGGLSGNEASMAHYVSYVSAIESNGNSKGSILLIETNHMLLEVEKKVVEEMGYSYSICKNGVAALNRLLTEDFEAVITGQAIDGLTGVSIISALKSMKARNQNTTAILVSTDLKIKSQFIKELLPDSIFEKNAQLVDNLKKILKGLSDKGENEKDSQSSLSKILYVEDDKILQKVFKSSMKKYSNAEVKVTDDKNSTVELLKEFIPDVILLDNYLKDCKGAEILETFSGNDLLNKIPVIFFTASPDELNLSDLKKIGNVKGIMGKPFSAKSLVGDIVKMIG